MALKSDDSDIRKSWLTLQLGGNGDYYVNIISEKNGLKEVSRVRVSTSGGNAPTDVRRAVADLYREMDQAGLNEYPDDTPEKETTKVKCNCSCHRNPEVKHVVECCDNGWIEVDTPEKEESQEAMLREIIDNYREFQHWSKNEDGKYSEQSFIEAELEKFTITRKTINPK